MQGGNRTGPNGLGPATGRGAGYCTGNTAPGYATPSFGQRGSGRGFNQFSRGGFRNRFYSAGFTGIKQDSLQNTFTQPHFESVDILKNQAKIMQDNLDAINQKIGELENIETDKSV